MRRTSRSAAASLAILACFLLGLGPAPPPPEVEILALEGERAPGTADGVVFDFFRFVLADGAGRVAFNGSLVGTDVTPANYWGVWQETSPGVVSLRARTGDQAPDTSPGVVFADILDLRLGEAGRLAFWGRLAGPGVNNTNDEGIWATDSAGTLRLVARSGQTAPGVGDPWTEIGAPSLGSGGRVGFSAGLGSQGGTWTGGIWVFEESIGTSLIQATGTQAHGAPVDWLYWYIPPPVFDADGSMLFTARLSVPCLLCEYYRSGLWRVQPGGTPTLLHLAGDPAPGTEPATAFNMFWSLWVSASGRLALNAILEGPSVYVGNDWSIWTREPTGEIALLARGVQDAPGFPGGVILASPHVRGSTVGHVVFWGSLSGGGFIANQDQAVWLAPTDGSEPIVLAHSHGALPGLPEGVVPDLISSDVETNESGRVLFSAVLQGPGVDASNENMAGLADGAGRFLMLLRGGVELDVRGEQRLLLGADPDPALGGTGAVAASLSFSDGSKAVVRLTPGATPVPGLGSPALVCTLALLGALGAARLWRGSGARASGAAG